ncbi:hypothetical protein HUK80_17530 [Flavobacterium sp. MAH-1]|uniref:Apea-like HEPN domain-containing protein n=1 Tax=Flavobacterium agri TaxID=2743471 RepID=A0A7Y8Y575_9FLAO|nr:hypothetical protein [Flavobacterium agri]NUY82708.1 hypothetical protein [Flavobacterium agri]NYA72731.1 hypothetical protein [Flavobacterium agri]
MNPDKLYLAIYHDEEGKKSRISITNYLNLIAEKDKVEISKFIYNRLYSRYIKPFSFDDENFKSQFINGFSIMANSCLLIETLESFKQGFGDTNGKSEKMFVDFFNSEANFEVLKTHAKNFYKNIRCGILHQGETTGGWILVKRAEKLFESEKLKINPILFMEQLKVSLEGYKEKLQNEEWDSATWDNFRSKMRKIISNCE